MSSEGVVNIDSAAFITENSRAATALPTHDIWKNFKSLETARQNPFLGTLMDADFKRLEDNVYRSYTDTTCTILPTANAIGELALLASADNEEAAVQWDLPIDLAGGDPWAFEARVKLENITDARATVFLGLYVPGALAGDVIADDGAALTDGDAIGFARLAADGDAVDLIYDEGGQDTNTHDDDVKVPVADTYFTVGLFYDGIQIHVYVDGVSTGDPITATDIAAADFPTAAVVVPTFAVKGDNAADFTATLDWIRVFQGEIRG